MNILHRFSKSIFLLVLFTIVFTSCAQFKSSKQNTVSEQNQSIDRNLAALSTGVDYPAERSFDLENEIGQNYLYFIKTKVKPALDSLSSKENGGGGGFENVGSQPYLKYKNELLKKTLASYQGAQWNPNSNMMEEGLDDAKVARVFDRLKEIQPRSTIDSLGYFKKEDENWKSKNHMAQALKEENIKKQPFDFATLYALTSGIGVKVKINDQNYNYHVMYKTGKTKPSEEVMSGRSFASAPGHGVTDATDPEYLRDLRKYLNETSDIKKFYRAMILVLSNSDASGWSELSDDGQALLSDFLTVYTAEAVRHLMVNLKPGVHPWEVDLAAVTLVSAVSNKLGIVVVDRKITEGNIGKWFAPSPNNQPGKPKRSGIGITRKDRKIFQKAIHQHLKTLKEGRELIAKIQEVIGKKRYGSDIVQGIFEFYSQVKTPQTIRDEAPKLADAVAQLTELAVNESEGILQVLKKITND